MGRNRAIVRTQLAGRAGYQFFEDTNFVVGDSPDIIDVNAALGRNAVDGSITNDGPGKFTFAIESSTADGFGDEVTMKTTEVFSLEGMDAKRIRITHVADSAFRVFVK